jgi:hypothetical protein
MTARVLDGNAVARAIREEVVQVAAFTATAGRPPELGIVLVGDDPASHVYVRNKIRAGMDAGMFVDLQQLPATATLDDVLGVVGRLNASDVHDRHPQSPLLGRWAARPSARCSTSSIREGRGWLQPGVTSASWCRSATVSGVHACGRDRTARPGGIAMRASAPS